MLVRLFLYDRGKKNLHISYFIKNLPHVEKKFLYHAFFPCGILGYGMECNMKQFSFGAFKIKCMVYYKEAKMNI